MLARNDEGDSAWSASGTGTTDANASPTFTSSATFSAAENQTAAGTVTATDSDAADSVTGYTIEGGADAGQFSIDAATGVLTFVAAPNYEMRRMPTGTTSTRWRCGRPAARVRGRRRRTSRSR